MTLSTKSSINEWPAEKVFIAGGDAVFAESLHGVLSGRGFSVVRCDDVEAALSVAAGFTPDIAFIDTGFTHAGGGNFLAELLNTCPDVICVVVAAPGEFDAALAANRAGVYDYLQRPPSAAALDIVLRRCTDKLDLMRERSALEKKLHDQARGSLLIADNIPAGITYIDTEMRFRFVNKVAAQWLGSPPDALIGRDIGEIMGPAAYEGLQHAVEKALRGAALQRNDDVSRWRHPRCRSVLRFRIRSGGKGHGLLRPRYRYDRTDPRRTVIGEKRAPPETGTRSGQARSLGLGYGGGELSVLFGRARPHSRRIRR